MRRDSNRSATLAVVKSFPLSSTNPTSPPAKVPVNTRIPEPVLAVSILAIAQSPAQPLPPSVKVASPEPSLAKMPYNVCPACGLQAPEKLMTEHFLGSPLHRISSQPVPEAPLSPEPIPISASQSIGSFEEDVGSSSLGDLLQTLNVMESLLQRDFYRHELRVRSGIGGRMTNIGGWIPQPLPLTKSL